MEAESAEITSGAMVKNMPVLQIVVLRAAHHLRRTAAESQSGFALVEVLVALGVIGITFSGFLGALTTSSTTTILDEERTLGRNMAEAQMEYAQSQAYDIVNDPPEYDIMPGVPNSYTVTCTATRLDPESDGASDDDGLQRIEVTVQHRGKTVATLEAYMMR